MFPDDVVKEIYVKNEIQRVFLFQNLIDTDNTSLFLFLFVNFRVLLIKNNQKYNY